MSVANLTIKQFKSVELQPGVTLKVFDRYIERLELVFLLVFRKADGTPYEPSDREKKAMLLLKGGDDMLERLPTPTHSRLLS